MTHAHRMGRQVRALEYRGHAECAEKHRDAFEQFVRVFQSIYGYGGRFSLRLVFRMAMLEPIQ